MTNALAHDRRWDEVTPALDCTSICRSSTSRAPSLRAPNRYFASVPAACGWTDLGTPRRVAQTLRRFQLAPTIHPPGERVRVSAFVDLAANCARLSATIGCPAEAARGSPA